MTVPPAAASLFGGGPISSQLVGPETMTLHDRDLDALFAKLNARYFGGVVRIIPCRFVEASLMDRLGLSRPVAVWGEAVLFAADDFRSAEHTEELRRGMLVAMCGIRSNADRRSPNAPETFEPVRRGRLRALLYAGETWVALLLWQGSSASSSMARRRVPQPQERRG